MPSIETVICRCGNWTRVNDAGSQRTLKCAKCGASLTLYAVGSVDKAKPYVLISIIAIVVIVSFMLLNVSKWFAPPTPIVVQDLGPAGTKPNAQQPPTPSPAPAPDTAPEPYTAPTPDEAAKIDKELPIPVPPFVAPEVPREHAIDSIPLIEVAKKVPSPRTGVLRRAHGAYEAPLKIETPFGSNYVIKMVNARSGKEFMSVYIQGGQTFDTKVPLGNYRFKVATGDDWYGDKKLFGINTIYSRLSQKFDPAGDVLAFWKDGRQLNGHIIKLTSVINGNLQQEKIRPEDF